MPNFQKSKNIGNFGEKLISNYLRLANIECEPNQNKETRSDYDLVCKVGKKKFTIEVKLDFLASKTGNLAIEVGNTNTGKDSGLLITKADLWCVILKDSENWVVFLTRTSELIKYVNSHQGRKINGAGDGNANLILYKTDDILSIFKRIDNLGKIMSDKIDYTGIEKTIRGLLNGKS